MQNVFYEVLIRYLNIIYMIFGLQMLNKVRQKMLSNSIHYKYNWWAIYI
jgi:hypothetical protein